MSRQTLVILAIAAAVVGVLLYFRRQQATPATAVAGDTWNPLTELRAIATPPGAVNKGSTIVSSAAKATGAATKGACLALGGGASCDAVGAIQQKYVEKIGGPIATNIASVGKKAATTVTNTVSSAVSKLKFW